MEDGQTDHGNSDCEYSSWMDISDVDSEESPRAQDMAPKPKTSAAQALYPQVQLSSGGASALQKRQHQDSTSLEGGHNKKRKTNHNSANTTATSPVSLASDVGHVGTQGASESREKARAHSKKLFNNMVAKMYKYYRERGEPTMYVNISVSLSLSVSLSILFGQ